MPKYNYVWRLETEYSRTGVFWCGAARAVQDDTDCDPYLHPSPNEDPPLNFVTTACPGVWFFGFATLAQYRTWFYTRAARRRLAVWRNRSDGRDRVVLRRYRVPAGRHNFNRSMVQAVFVRERAEIVETREPDFC